jgi:solute carrier family 25 carnitine/acylcarnitine transporter 20/29
MEDYIYGGVSGLIQAVVGHPLDTLKVRMQNGSTKLHSPMAGLKYPLLTSVGICSASFGTYELLRKKDFGPFWGGFISGTIMSPMVFLADIGKVKRQTGKVVNWDAVIRQKGLSTTVCRESISFGFYFMTFESARKIGVHPLIAGGVAGMISWTSTYPLDVMRNRQISNNWSAVKATAQGNMWKGYGVCMARAFLVNSVGFYAYDFLRRNRPLGQN